MIIYTARVDYWKVMVTGKPPSGALLMDITVKNADTWFSKQFAPTWPMVRSYKAGALSAEDYATQYLELLNKRFGDSRYAHVVLKDWISYCNSQGINPILACYCQAGNFCHRVLAVNWLITFASSQLPEIEIIYGGELS